MFDTKLVCSILLQIDEAIDKIKMRTARIYTPDYFTGAPEGMEKLDSVAMLFIAVGESLKNLDKITRGALLSKYPEIDWTGVKGFRHVVAHHYFDIDAEQIFWVCKHDIEPLSATVKKMIEELKE